MQTLDTPLDILNSGDPESRLRYERRQLLDRIEKQLHCSDESRQRALAYRMAQIEDWTAVDLQADIDIAPLGQELSGLRDIDAALKRIAKGTYGICHECGKEIDPGRLNVQPAVRLCLACKEAFEKRRGIVSHSVHQGGK